jgi:opacity protein-like surface antigen
MIGKKQKLDLCILFLMLLPAATFGQDYAYKGAVFGGLGFGQFYDDEGSLGKGLTYRAGVEWRPQGRLGFEADLLGSQFERNDYFNVRGNAQFIFANALYYFSKSKFQPYIKGGIGGFRTRYSYGWPISSPEQYHASKAGAAFDLGAGVRFFPSRHWSVNPDLRLLGGVAGYALLSYFSISAAYHW